MPTAPSYPNRTLTLTLRIPKYLAWNEPSNHSKVLSTAMSQEVQAGWAWLELVTYSNFELGPACAKIERG